MFFRRGKRGRKRLQAIADAYPPSHLCPAKENGPQRRKRVYFGAELHFLRFGLKWRDCVHLQTHRQQPACIKNMTEDNANAASEPFALIRCLVESVIAKGLVSPDVLFF